MDWNNPPKNNSLGIFPQIPEVWDQNIFFSSLLLIGSLDGLIIKLT